MKATLADGTVLEGTPEEMLAMGVGGGGPRVCLFTTACGCAGHMVAGDVCWWCQSHGWQVKIGSGYPASNGTALFASPRATAN